MCRLVCSEVYLSLALGLMAILDVVMKLFVSVVKFLCPLCNIGRYHSYFSLEKENRRSFPNLVQDNRSVG